MFEDRLVQRQAMVLRSCCVLAVLGMLPSCSQPSPGCLDGDGDGYGHGCAAGEDACDEDPDNWTSVSCAACVDADRDGYVAYCDAADLDVDACDDDPHNWTQAACATCADTDGDGYGAGCDRGEDACDDNAYAHSAGWCGQPVGPLRCDQILDCARGCNDDDTTCSFNCLERGTEDARRAHSALYDCLAECEGQDESCFAERCAEPIAACTFSCDLLGDDCGLGMACYPGVDGGVCAPTSALPVGADCDPGNLEPLPCASGSVCLGDGPEGRCAAFCERPGDCPMGYRCDLSEAIFDDFPGLRICVAEP